jgi:hypothetical protein
VAPRCLLYITDGGGAGGSLLCQGLFLSMIIFLSPFASCKSFPQGALALWALDTNLQTKKYTSTLREHFIVQYCFKTRELLLVHKCTCRET